MTDQRRRPTARILAGTLALSVATGTALLATAGPAGAAAPRAQAVGRFLDGALGGSPIQSIADLHDARATYPGTTSSRNPLDVTLGGQADIPLSGKLQAPGNNVFHVGVANQVATAKANGYALGAAGAVANQGGAAIGGQGGAPADATLNLSGAALPAAPLSLPGAGSAKTLGGLSAEFGAVAARAHTPVGAGRTGVTQYSIGSLKLVLASPALGKVLGQLSKQLKPPALPTTGLPIKFPKKACSFKVQALSPISLAGGTVTIDPTSGSITIDVAALLHALGVNINALPANTDLLAYVLNYLGSAKGFAAGLQSVVSNTFVAQKQNFLNCTNTIAANFPAPFKTLVQDLYNQFKAGQTQVTDAINGVISQLAAAGGPNPFQPLVDGLKQALQIGVNVQPHGPRGTYRSPLAATPDQATPVVAGQTIVRAIEIDLGGGSGVDLGLANAAAGPSTQTSAAPPPAPSTTPAVVHNHQIPTGIPAGQAPTGGGPQLPLELLAIGVALAAAGGLAYRLRPRRH
jgi:hypothetical protein